MLEKIIEAYLRKRIKDLGGACFKFLSPGNSGVPDRICVMRDGQIIFVECKQPNGRLSNIQEIQIARLRKLGCKVLIIWSKEDVDKFFPAP